MGRIFVGVALLLIFLVQPSIAHAESIECGLPGVGLHSVEEPQPALADESELSDGGAQLSSFENDLTDPATLYSPTSVSDNWSGYVVRPAGGYSYRSITARYIVPAITRTSNSACANSGYGGWIGIGGFAQSQLAQIGLAEGDVAGSTYIFEMVCKPSACQSVKTNFASLAYKPGDLLEFTIGFNATPGNGSRSGTITATVTNLSPNVGLNSFTTTFTSSTAMDYYDGTSAEWIDEAPYSLSLGQLPLSNFGKTYWSNAKVLDEQSRTWGSLGSENETKVVMFSLSRLTILSSPSDLTSTTSFNTSYLACK